MIATSTIQSGSILFGRALSTPETDALRAHLSRALEPIGLEAVAVETFCDLFHALRQLPSDAAPRPLSTPRHVLVLDLQRAIVFRDSAAAGEPGLSSLVRFLLDGYPLQPFLRFAAAEQDRPYRFSFEPGVLDISARCLAELAPGEYSALDFLTGAISPGRLTLHPQAIPPRIIDAHPYPLAAATPLRPVRTDRGLRSSGPPDLSGLIGAAAGVIRRDRTGPNIASMPCGITTISMNRGDANEVCGARSLSPAEAEAVSRCEALERFQVMKQKPAAEFVQGSYLELAEHAVDPRELFFGRSPECPEDDAIPFDPATPIHWMWAWGPAERRWRLVPAQDLWFNTATLMKEPRFVRATTNGCAIGATFEEASVAGVFEAIERDAFLTSWYLRRPATQIDFGSFETDVMRDLLGRFRLVFSGYRPVLIDITSDVGIPTIGAFAMRERGDGGDGARILVSAATDIDAETASARALKDLIGFRPDISPERKAELRERLSDPSLVVGVDGHWELYVLDEVFGAFDYLQLDARPTVAVQDIGHVSPVPRDPELRLDLLLETIDRRLHEAGAEMYLVDLTHQGLVSTGLRTARAVTPGLYPIWFGALRRRFAITERLHRLAERYTGRPFAREQLQLAPHPMH